MRDGRRCVLDANEWVDIQRRDSGCSFSHAGIQPRDLTINKLSQFQFIQEPSFVSDEYRAKCTRLVSWNVGSSVLFFLDPIAVEIVEWHLDLGIIHDLKVRKASQCLSDVVCLAVRSHTNESRS